MTIETLPEVELAPVYPEHLTLQVLLHDISAGVRGDPKSCAIARATERRFDGADVTVGSYGLIVGRNTTHPHYYLPDDRMAHQQFIADFDGGMPVQPCELHFTETTALGYHRGRPASFEDYFIGKFEGNVFVSSAKATAELYEALKSQKPVKLEPMPWA